MNAITRTAFAACAALVLASLVGRAQQVPAVPALGDPRVGLKAGFRDAGKTLDTFDFEFNKKMNRRLVFELASGRFVTQHEDGSIHVLAHNSRFCADESCLTRYSTRLASARSAQVRWPSNRNGGSGGIGIGLTSDVTGSRKTTVGNNGSSSRTWRRKSSDTVATSAPVYQGERGCVPAPRVGAFATAPWTGNNVPCEPGTGSFF